MVRDRLKLTDLFIAIATVVTALAAIKACDISSDLTKITRESTDTTNRALEADIAPWVAVDVEMRPDLAAEEGGAALVTRARNFGKGVALLVKIKMRGFLNEKEFAIRDQAPHAALAPTQDLRADIQLSREGLAWILGGTRLKVFVEWSYQSVTGREFRHSEEGIYDVKSKTFKVVHVSGPSDPLGIRSAPTPGD